MLAPKGLTWKWTYIDEVCPDITDAKWARVHFTGLIPDDKFIAAFQVSQAHIYLTSPFVASWSLLETMNAEAAIIASETEPVPEVMRNGETGMLVDFFDLKGF